MIGADTTFLVQLELIELAMHRTAHELLRREILDANVPLGLAPQVLAEFIHIVTDSRRFQRPLTAHEALVRARFWWNAAEVSRVFPTQESTELFLGFMERHQLGRKRILDTQLAATLWNAGVRRIITSNPSDFELFGFEAIVPR